MLIGSWAFARPSKGDYERERRQMEDKDLQRLFPKKVIFKANVKLCETKLSGG